MIRCVPISAADEALIYCATPVTRTCRPDFESLIVTTGPRLPMRRYIAPVRREIARVGIHVAHRYGDYVASSLRTVTKANCMAHHVQRSRSHLHEPDNAIDRKL